MTRTIILVLTAMMFGVIIILVWCLTSSAQDIPTVTIDDGTMSGQILTTKNGRSFSSFTGIPFAKPPLGSLRFKPPEPNDPWNGTLDASINRNICLQRNLYFRSPIIEGDEDCLYLNVYSPVIPPKRFQEKKQRRNIRSKRTSNSCRRTSKSDNRYSHSDITKSLPVMVFIHGGGFFSGSGIFYMYSPTILLDKDVVLVTLNYRLGPLGFLSTGDEVVPGNMGLKDQVMALKWVRKNIHKFGGNPDLVTIFGESAGAASVHFHVLSPLSKGLFNGAILESGNAFCPWAFQVDNYVFNNSVKLAKELKCSTESNQQLVDCLRNMKAYAIIDQDQKFMQWDFDPMIPFKPVAEPDLPGAFLTGHPVDIIRSGKASDVPMIMGINSQDGGLKITGVSTSPELSKEFEKKFDEIIVMSLEYDTFLGTATNSFIKKIKEFYYGNAPVDNSQIMKTIDLYTDAWFLNSMDTTIRLHAEQNSQPIFYYLFEYRGSASFSEVFSRSNKDFGVCHADELLYLFPMRELFSKTQITATDKKVTDLMTTLWYNFANTRNPTPKINGIVSEKWEPYCTNEEYYHITDVAKTKYRMLPERTKLWSSLISEPVFGIKNDL